MRSFLLRQTSFVILACAAMPSMLVAQTADPAVPTAPAAKPVKEKKVCRTTDNTGSRLGGTRSCHTIAEWADIDKRDSQTTGIKVQHGAGPTQQ